MNIIRILVVPILAFAFSGFCWAERGEVSLQYAGPLAFAPDGVLLVGDTLGATLYAIETGDIQPSPGMGSINLTQVDSKIAAALGTQSDNISINDLAVNQLSGNAYLSVERGNGDEAVAVILKITPSGDISELMLDDVAYTSAPLPNAPALDSLDWGGESNRLVSITDIGYHDGKIVVAGLSNEEFASTLRTLKYPLDSAGNGTSVEIYHGNHGAWETRSPVRAFTTVDIQGKPYVIAAYTCTPLVLFPLDSLEEGAKVNGITVAELGAGNRPLDMFVYGEDGNQHILMSNSRYGIMKITLQDITQAEAITARVEGGTAGQDFETVEQMAGVIQMAQVSTGALALVSNENSMDLRTFALP